MNPFQRVIPKCDSPTCRGKRIVSREKVAAENVAADVRRRNLIHPPPSKKLPLEVVLEQGGVD